MSERILLIADDGFDGPAALPDAVRDEVTHAAHVEVIAPTIGSRLDTLTEDESIYEDAVARAKRVVQALRDAGIDADGDHSESGPLAAAQARARTEEIDAIVVVTTGEGHWREEGLLEELRSSVDVPVRGVSV